MKRYTFEVLIEEGNDEFWEQITKEKSTGCDKVKELLTDILPQFGFYDGENVFVRLVKFEDI